MLLGDNAGMRPHTIRRPRVNWVLVLLGVAALHLLLLSSLQHALRSPPPRPAAASAPFVLVRQLPPPAAPQLEPPQPPRPVPRRPVRNPTPAPTTPVQTEPAIAAPAAPAVPAAPASAATAAASAPAGGLLDTEASRGAIRDLARRRSTGELGAQATGASAPLGAQQRLGQEIARGARGDCLKGEYAGAGMGLLSLPFWLMAELGDKCRR